MAVDATISNAEIIGLSYTLDGGLTLIRQEALLNFPDFRGRIIIDL